MEENLKNDDVQIVGEEPEVETAMVDVKERVLLGIIGAFLGSLIGAICIVLLNQFGYIASICGVVMGICTFKGYVLLGKKMSIKGLIFSGIIMLVMVYFSNMVSYGLAVAEYYQVDILTGTFAVNYLIVEGGIDAAAYVKDLFMLVVFTAIGAVPTVKERFKQNK